jgi:hypothetical protein
LTLLFLVLLLLGIGSLHPANNSIIMGTVTKDLLGTASALIATLRQVCIDVGMAVTGTFFSARLIVHKTMLHPEGLSEASAESLSIPPAFHDGQINSAIIPTIIFVGKK